MDNKMNYAHDNSVMAQDEIPYRICQICLL
jgi:hypothetical protein